MRSDDQAARSSWALVLVTSSCGLSTGDVAPALAGFFGTDAGLSASTVNRLCEAWQAEQAEWATRDLSEVDYVYIWADGVYPPGAAARRGRGA